MALKDSLESRFAAQLSELEKSGSLRSLKPYRHEGKYSYIDGRRLLNLASNDYLGLGSDLDLQAEFLDGMGKNDFVMSSVSSRLLTGNKAPYLSLEQLLAELYGREAALVFSSGYHANSGILPALCDKDTLVLADKLVHASIIDGIRLSAATSLRYRHGDYDQLERLIAERGSAFSSVIVASESVFSMDGDRADLRRLVSIKKKYPGVYLYVDEAHAFGVLGERGLGLSELTGTAGDIDFLVGTFGKAAASQGAFVVCSEQARRYLINRMRTLIYTTALPPINLMWTEFVVRRFPGFNDRRERLQAMSDKLIGTLRNKGYECGSEGCIVPVMAYEIPAAAGLSDKFLSGGYYAPVLRPPTVPVGGARLRLSLTAAISPDEISDLIKFIPPFSELKTAPRNETEAH